MKAVFPELCVIIYPKFSPFLAKENSRTMFVLKSDQIAKDNLFFFPSLSIRTSPTALAKPCCLNFDYFNSKPKLARQRSYIPANFCKLFQALTTLRKNQRATWNVGK